MSRTVGIVVVVACASLLVSLLPLSAMASVASGWEQRSLTEAVFALATDPSSDGTVYATGESGLWKTVDGGAKWSLVSPEKISGALTIDPKNPSVIYASGNRTRGGEGIYKSSDGGRNWSIVRSGESPNQIIVDPVNTGIIYAGLMMNSNYEILKSTDGGASWNRLLRPQFSQSPGMGWVTALTLAPSRSSVIYAGLAGYHYGSLIRSDDGGINWREISGKNRPPLMTPSSIAVDPQDPDIVYVGWSLMGSKRFFKGVDGGTSWQELSAALPAGGSALHTMLFDPADSNTLIATLPGNSGSMPGTGTPGGVFISYDRGASWTDLGADGANLTVMAIAAQSRVLYAGGHGGIATYRLGFRVDQRFLSYYDSHDGLRVLGGPIGPPSNVNGYPSQYFEKGRIEDHAGEVADENWKLMYGLLADELQGAKANLPVGGDASSVKYADLYNYARPDQRIALPAGFAGGVMANPDGSTFVPYHSDLKPEAGHNVPKLFWDYIGRTDLFPGGWLHDIGLPMTEAISATVDKGDMKGRTITIQAFQRTVLTFDGANPPDWQVERANVGTDYQQAFGR